MKNILIIFFGIIISFNGNSQKLGKTGKLIQGGIDDGVKLINAYVEPLNKSIMVGMNNNSFNKIYKDSDGKRFSVSLRSNIISIPDKDRTFDINSLGLQELEAEDAENSIAQTALGDSSIIRIGSKSKTVDVTVFPPVTKSIFSFNSAPGSGRTNMVIPYIHFAYSFDYASISLGAIPLVKLPNSDFQLSLVGVDWQQDLGKFLPIRDLPIKISVLGGYYFFYGHSDLTVEPGDVLVNVNFTGDVQGPYDNQELKVIYNSAYASIFASYDLELISFFGGIGFNSSHSNIRVLGNYPVYYKSPGGNLIVKSKDVVDPMDSDTHFNRFKAEIGARLDLKRYFFQANYVFGDYGGIGVELGVRF